MHVYKELTLFHKQENIFLKYNYQSEETSNSEKFSNKG